MTFALAFLGIIVAVVVILFAVETIAVVVAAVVLLLAVVGMAIGTPTRTSFPLSTCRSHRRLR